jgi:hypothetical protein
MIRNPLDPRRNVIASETKQSSGNRHAALSLDRRGGCAASR